MKVGFPLAKNILALLGVTTATSAIDGGVQKKIYGSGTTTLIIPNKKINDMIEIIQKKNKTKKQEGEFLSLLLGTLGASL